MLSIETFESYVEYDAILNGGLKNINTVEYLLNKYKPFDDLEKSDLKKFRGFVKKYKNKIYDRTPGQPTITASAIVVNPELTKMLVMYHKFQKTYRQFGGHADGNPDLFTVAKNELKEESGINGKPVFNYPIDIIRWNFPERTKNNIFYPAHDCFDIAFLFVIPENSKLNPNKDEVSDIKWISITDWRDYHDSENEVVKMNPHEQMYNQRTFQKIKMIADKNNSVKR